MEKLKQTIQNIMDEAVAKEKIAGGNLLVLKDGKELFYLQTGYADVEKKIPYSRDTIARLYSMTKPVTAVAMMILIERGLVDLGRGISLIFPDFEAPMVWEKGRKAKEFIIKEKNNVKQAEKVTAFLSNLDQK